MARPAPCWCHSQRKMSTTLMTLLPDTKPKNYHFIFSSFRRPSSFHSLFLLSSSVPLSLLPPLPRRVRAPALSSSLLPPWKCWSLMIQPNNRRRVPGSPVASRDPRPPPLLPLPPSSPPSLPSRPLVPLPSSHFSSLSSPDQGHLLCYNSSSLFLFFSLFIYPFSPHLFFSLRLSFLSPLLSLDIYVYFFTGVPIFFILFDYIHPLVATKLFLFFTFLTLSSLFHALFLPTSLPPPSLRHPVEQTDFVFTSGATVYGDVLPLLVKAK